MSGHGAQTQQALVHVNWSVEEQKLPGCKMGLQKDGSVLWNGPKAMLLKHLMTLCLLLCLLQRCS